MTREGEGLAVILGLEPVRKKPMGPDPREIREAMAEEMIAAMKDEDAPRLSQLMCDFFEHEQLLRADVDEPERY